MWRICRISDVSNMVRLVETGTKNGKFLCCITTIKDSPCHSSNRRYHCLHQSRPCRLTFPQPQNRGFPSVNRAEPMICVLFAQDPNAPAAAALSTPERWDQKLRFKLGKWLPQLCFYVIAAVGELVGPETSSKTSHVISKAFSHPRGSFHSWGTFSSRRRQRRAAFRRHTRRLMINHQREDNRRQEVNVCNSVGSNSIFIQRNEKWNTKYRKYRKTGWMKTDKNAAIKAQQRQETEGEKNYIKITHISQ